MGNKKDARTFSGIAHNRNMGNDFYLHKNPFGGFQACGNFVFPLCHGIFRFACDFSKTIENGKQIGTILTLTGLFLSEYKLERKKQ